jgi:D-sedoheptulose 7-phosphate isomerase
VTARTELGQVGPVPNPLAGLADEALCVAGADTSVVQEVHLVAIHTLCEALDAEIAAVMAP